MLFDAYSGGSWSERMSAHTQLEHVWLPYGHSAYDADLQEKLEDHRPQKKVGTQAGQSELES